MLPGHTCREPLESTLPTPPSIETLLAFDVDQVSVEQPPASTDDGDADREAVGEGAAGEEGSEEESCEKEGRAGETRGERRQAHGDRGSRRSDRLACS